MPAKNNLTLNEDGPNDAPATESTDKKTKQTVPTLYPDIEFINRTLP